MSAQHRRDPDYYRPPRIPNQTGNDAEFQDYDPDVPHALDNAVKCPCGGVALFHVARTRGDVPHMHCSNPRCGRLVPLEGRSMGEAVEKWNTDIRQDSCAKHGSMLRDDGKFYCPHCDKDMAT